MLPDVPNHAALAAASSEPREQRQHALARARALHWQRTRRITALLLGLWLATSFGTVFFARDLAHLALFGWPLSFYMAAQGASLVYLAIVAGYAVRMRRLDRDFDQERARLAGEEA
jgi:putative solute:sodium symporter small subunit